MFSLILDDYAYTDPGDCCKQHIAGPAQNRWPDKSFSVVMGHCGKAGVVFEERVSIFKFFPLAKFKLNNFILS